MHQYEYPAPGYPKIHMLWKYGGPWIGTMTATNRYAKMYTHPSLEFVVSQPIWFEGEVQFADVILPACTNFERWDISEFGNCSGYIPDNYNQCNHRVISLQAKCIEPVGESKSDYQIFALLAKKLGIEGPFTEGKDELGWIKQYFHATDLPKYITWEEFLKKGYFVVPDNPNRNKNVALRWFAENRAKDTARLGAASEQPGRLSRPADFHRQGRVHRHQHQELRGPGLRRRVPSGHAQVRSGVGELAL